MVTVLIQLAVTQPQKKAKLDFKVGILTNNKGFGGVGRQAVFTPDQKIIDTVLGGGPTTIDDRIAEIVKDGTTKSLVIQGENDMDYRTNDFMGLRTSGNQPTK